MKKHWIQFEYFVIQFQKRNPSSIAHSVLCRGVEVFEFRRNPFNLNKGAGNWIQLARATGVSEKGN